MPTPRWLTFLHEIFAGDLDLIAFMQRLLGYALVGEQAEHIFPVFWGAVANGKTTLTRLLLAAFGDYGLALNKDFLMQAKIPRHSTEMMELYQIRLAVASETDEGARINEALIKNLTGGNTVRGRRLYQEEWGYEPTHTVCLETNHKPRIIGVDQGMWRRIFLIPFDVQIPEQNRDPHLLEKLKSEIPGILSWLVNGCLQWQQGGLNPPEAVVAATEQYREESDLFGAFLKECCRLGRKLKVRASDFYAAYESRARSRNEFPQSQTRVEERLHQLNVTKRHTEQGKFLFGIELTDQSLINDYEEVNE